MEYKSLYDYYWFGTCFRYLQDASLNHPVKEHAGVLYNIREMYVYLEDLNLPVTKRVAKDLLKDFETELDDYNDNDKLTHEHADALKRKIETIRTTLDAEIQDVGAFTPTTKRLDLKRLLENVGALFAPNIFDVLPEIARYDLNEAGKCIAFERATAAAFHILRATEDVLRFYYRSMIRQNRIKSQNWGPIVNDLRTRNKTKNHAILNNHLDNIRSSFRNPTQHPEARYDIHEVQDLWSVCADVINRMIRTLEEEGRL